MYDSFDNTYQVGALLIWLYVGSTCLLYLYMMELFGDYYMCLSNEKPHVKRLNR